MSLKYQGHLTLYTPDIDQGEWAINFPEFPYRVEGDYVSFDLGKGRYGIMYRIPSRSRTKVRLKIVVVQVNNPGVIAGQYDIETDKILGRYPGTSPGNIFDEDGSMPPSEPSEMHGNTYRPRAVLTLSPDRYAVILGTTSGQATTVFFMRWDGSKFVAGRGIPTINAGDRRDATSSSDFVTSQWRGFNGIGLRVGNNQLLDFRAEGWPQLIEDSRDTFYVIQYAPYTRKQISSDNEYLPDLESGEAIAYRKYMVVGDDVEPLGLWSIKPVLIEGDSTGPSFFSQNHVRSGDNVFTVGNGARLREAIDGAWVPLVRTNLITGQTTIKRIGPFKGTNVTAPLGSLVKTKGGGIEFVTYTLSNSDS